MLYEEAFLTTYRTFVTSKDLLDKLIYRYHHFRKLGDVQASNTFSLLARVVDELRFVVTFFSFIFKCLLLSTQL